MILLQSMILIAVYLILAKRSYLKCKKLLLGNYMKITRNQLRKLIKESLNPRMFIQDLTNLYALFFGISQPGESRLDSLDYNDLCTVKEYVRLSTISEKEKHQTRRLTFNPTTVSNDLNIKRYIERAMRQAQGNEYKNDTHVVLINFLSGLAGSMLESDLCWEHYTNSKVRKSCQADVFVKFHKLSYKICEEHNKDFTGVEFLNSKYDNLTQVAKERLNELLKG